MCRRRAQRSFASAKRERVRKPDRMYGFPLLNGGQRDKRREKTVCPTAY
jgi:hypothetical protein